MTQAASVHSTPRNDSSLLLSTDDDQVGIRWWNNLPEEDRQYWMRLAGDTGRAVDAWRAFKAAIMADTGYVIWPTEATGRELDPRSVLIELFKEELHPDAEWLADRVIERLRDAGFVIKPIEYPKSVS